jgi:hypothetical protein
MVGKYLLPSGAKMLFDIELFACIVILSGIRQILNLRYMSVDQEYKFYIVNEKIEMHINYV